MRRTILAGVVLAVAAVLVVVVSSALDLELESVALLGAALGAVVALVPDRTPLLRLGGFAAGFIAAWIGYGLRAAVLPDTAGGRAVAVGLVVLMCVGVTALSAGRLPMWSTLLGTAALAGAYEFTFAAAPPELVSTSVSTATTLLFNVAVGFLAAALVAPGEPADARLDGRHAAPQGDDSHTTADADADVTAKLDDFLMEKTK